MNVASDRLSRFSKPGKACFDDVYDLPDPRAYWRAVGALDYRTPYGVRGLILKAIAALRQVRSKPTVTVLDLCCGYGTNAVMVNYDVGDGGLYGRYRDPNMDDLTPEQVIQSDRAFFSDHARPAGALFGGVDVAPGPLSYVRRAGLMHSAFNIDLETQDPDRELLAFLNRVDLIVETGGVGYIGAASFRRLLSSFARERLAWVIAAPMRLVEFEPVADVWREFGLTVEKASRSIPHRRFKDDRERNYVMGEMAARGIDTAGKEASGMMHAEVYLARDAREAAAVPFAELEAALVADGG